MDYQRIHDVIIDRGKRRTLINVYKERHHIIPRCRGGSNRTENLVDLTPEEHFVVHQLLVKLYPGNAQLLAAARHMTLHSKTHQGRRTNKLYGWLKRRIAAPTEVVACLHCAAPFVRRANHKNKPVFCSTRCRSLSPRPRDPEKMAKLAEDARKRILDKSPTRGKRWVTHMSERRSFMIFAHESVPEGCVSGRNRWKSVKPLRPKTLKKTQVSSPRPCRSRVKKNPLDVRRSIAVDGQVYTSCTDAAKALGIGYTTLMFRLNTGKPGYVTLKATETRKQNVPVV